jgi:mono/diheme cytochrome c family protein
MKISIPNHLLIALFAVAANAAEIDFARDVRPILASNCFDCHGPDKAARKAGRRLDNRSGAYAETDGVRAVVPGDLGHSELFRRISSSDPGERMPPAKTKRTLSDGEVATLRSWIEQGGNYAEHWAFIRPARPELPEVKRKGWVRGEIDRFVLARLEKEGMAPSPEADRYTLIKRVYLDLIGLPPTPGEADAFVSDESQDAYEKVVDRLLKSKHYGERWARRWLDLARYSDTNGYEKDRPRSIWPYRDWVINAINSGMPFDQFTVEQLAGDMLPNASVSHRVATGFHRNTMLNEEGGIDPLEFRFHAMVDRVATTGTTWLGLTLMCAQCHTHKYDPIEHSEYYGIMAFLNNADEPDLDVPDPQLKQRRRKLEFDIAMAERDLVNQFPFPHEIRFSKEAEQSPEVKALRREWVDKRFSKWIESARSKAVNWRILKPVELSSTMPKLRVLEDGSVLATGDQTKRDIYSTRFKPSLRGITALRLEVLPHESLPAGGPGFAYYEGPKGDFFLSELSIRAGGKPVKVSDASETYAKIGIGSGKVSAALTLDGKGETGWSTAKAGGKRHVAVYVFEKPIDQAASLDLEMLFERHYPAGLGRYRISVTDQTEIPSANEIPDEVERHLLKSAKDWSWEEREAVFAHFLATDPALKEARAEIDKMRAQLPEFAATLAFQERPEDHPRPTYRHHRGEYVQPREGVIAGLPAVFGVPDRVPKNRLEFARWLVDGQNPLTARVVMNRQWEAIFGRGIVKTSEDFGTQSSSPSHPALLDWLATEFVRRKWSVKEMHRLIVSSATYRQSSNLRPESAMKDPENILLARGARLRIEAEMVRDLTLAASGLLSSAIGGPSVYPPQPKSVTDLSYGKFTWNTSTGPDRYRRSLYTFAKRTAPFAAYLTFDGVSGESCIPKRERSNTPLQALTLLNDEVFIEAARALAKLAMGNARDEAEIVVQVFRRCLIRAPSPAEVTDLRGFYREQLTRLGQGELDASRIHPEATKSAPELAAWTMTARAILNLDETITKE